MLVIFDCDGVLVDSETLAAEVFSESLADYGIAMSAQACEQHFRGHTLPYCLRYLRAQGHGLDTAFLGYLEEKTRAAFGERLNAVAGVQAVLDQLSAHNVAFCVASNGSLAKVRHSLGVTGLLEYFEPNSRRVSRCFSAEMVASGKPAPDLFLHAAAQCDATPDTTWVIEDSLAGLAAAAAAKMTALHYAPGSRVRDAAVFGSMAELPGLLRFEGVLPG